MLVFQNDYRRRYPAILKRFAETNMEQLPGYGTDHTPRRRSPGVRLPRRRSASSPVARRPISWSLTRCFNRTKA